MIHPFSDFNIYKTGNIVVALEKHFKYIPFSCVSNMGRDTKF